MPGRRRRKRSRALPKGPVDSPGEPKEKLQRDNQAFNVGESKSRGTRRGALRHPPQLRSRRGGGEGRGGKEVEEEEEEESRGGKPPSPSSSFPAMVGEGGGAASSAAAHSIFHPPFSLFPLEEAVKEAKKALAQEEEVLKERIGALVQCRATVRRLTEIFATKEDKPMELLEDAKEREREATREYDEAKYAVWKAGKKILSLERSPICVEWWLRFAKPLAKGEEEQFIRLYGKPLPFFLDPDFTGAKHVRTIDPGRAAEHRSEVKGNTYQECVRSALGVLQTLSRDDTHALMPELEPFIMPTTPHPEDSPDTRHNVLVKLLDRTGPTTLQDARCQYITGSIGSSKSQLCRNFAAAIAIAQPQLDEDGKGITNVPIYVKHAGKANLLPTEAIAVGLAHCGLLFRKDEHDNLLVPSWVHSDDFVPSDWLKSCNLRVVLFIDEAQELYSSEFGAYRAGIASQQLGSAAALTEDATSTTTLMGSSSMLRPLLMAEKLESVVKHYPGLLHAENVNGSKFLGYSLGPILDVREAACFLENSGREEWVGVVEKVERREEEAVERVEGALFRTAGNARALSLSSGKQEGLVGQQVFEIAMRNGLAPIAVALWELTRSRARGDRGSRYAKLDVDAFHAGKLKVLKQIWKRGDVVQCLKTNEVLRETFDDPMRAEAIHRLLHLGVQEWVDRGFIQSSTNGQYLALRTTAHAISPSAWAFDTISDDEVRALLGCSPEAEAVGEKLVAEALFSHLVAVDPKLPVLKRKEWSGEHKDLVDNVWKVYPDATGEDLIVFQRISEDVKVTRVQVALGKGSRPMGGVGELRSQKKGETVWRITKSAKDWQDWVAEQFGVHCTRVKLVHIIAATTKVTDKKLWKEALEKGVREELWASKDTEVEIGEGTSKQSIKPTTSVASSFLHLCHGEPKFEAQVLDYNDLAPKWPQHIQDYAKRENLVHIMGAPSPPPSSSSSSLS